MSTRHAPEGAPLAQNRYMSAPEYTELRGISGTAVCARAALLKDRREASLVYFIQGMSLRCGGLPEFADQLLQMFPDRLPATDTRSRRRSVYCEILDEAEPKQATRAERAAQARAELPDFLTEICINPGTDLSQV